MSWQTRIGKALREVRLIISTSESSEGARAFARANLQQLQTSAPRFPLVVRECQGVDDFAVFRFDYGVERKVGIKGYSAQQIEEVVRANVEQAAAVNGTLQQAHK